MIKHIKLKIVAICVMCLSLQGCLWQSVSGTDLKKAYWYCDQKGKELATVSATWTGSVSVYCRGEPMIDLRDVEDMMILVFHKGACVK